MKSYMQIQMKKIQRHKRHFQLLELMVAAFILLICIAPTMRIFTSMYQSQQEIIRENQRDHLAHTAHAKIIEQLYKRQMIFEEGTESKPVPLSDPKLIELLEKSSFSMEGRLEILESYTPKGQDLPTMYLGKLVIKMKDLAYKPPKKESNKKIENQDPSESFYDYFVYIDSGEKNKDKKKEDKKVPGQDPASDKKSPNDADARGGFKVKEVSQ